MKATIKHDDDLRQYRGPDGKGWTCDRCGETIKTAGDGWLQWISVPTEAGGHKMRDLTLVHHVPASPRKQKDEHGCQFDQSAEFHKDSGIIEDLGLEAFCGEDGLTHLLSILVEAGSSQADVIEMLKRIHVRGYEQARFHFERAIAEGVIETNLPPGFYWQSQIRTVLEWMERNDIE